MDESSLLSPKAAATGYGLGVSETPRPPSMEKALNRNDASVNAVSFGFVATSVLISLFLAIAIFERYIRHRSALSPVPPLRSRDPAVNEGAQREGSLRTNDIATMSQDYVTGVSVLMPGQGIPTFIAKRVPNSYPHDGRYWPTHIQKGSCSFDSVPTSATIKEDHEKSSINVNGSSSMAGTGNDAA